MLASCIQMLTQEAFLQKSMSVTHGFRPEVCSRCSCEQSIVTELKPVLT